MPLISKPVVTVKFGRAKNKGWPPLNFLVDHDTYPGQEVWRCMVPACWKTAGDKKAYNGDKGVWIVDREEKKSVKKAMDMV